MSLVVEVLVGAAIAVVGLGLAVWIGDRMLKGGGPTTTGNALGGFNVFQPTREDAEEEMESKRQQIVALPADDDGPINVDILKNTAIIKRSAPGDRSADEAGK